MNKRFVFGKTSIILLSIGVMFLILGYILMATGDIVISPLLLILAHVVFFPASILVGLLNRKQEDSPKEADNQTQAPDRTPTKASTRREAR